MRYHACDACMSGIPICAIPQGLLACVGVIAAVTGDWKRSIDGSRQCAVPTATRSTPRGSAAGIRAARIGCLGFHKVAFACLEVVSRVLGLEAAVLALLPPTRTHPGAPRYVR